MTDKRVISISGLVEAVDVESLRAAFIPFGEIVSIHLPVNQDTKKHRGYAFVEYEEAQDAADAVDNLHNAEFFGNVIKLSYAKSRDASSESTERAVWDDTDYFQSKDSTDVQEVEKPS